jgi:hypothetical protein
MRKEIVYDTLTEKKKKNNFLFVEIKNVWGNELIYPNCTRSKIFCNIAGTKTLSRYIIDKIKDLGFEIKVSTPEL